jgi:hypothetical protein
MADNYIEKQREQYEARKAAWERAKKYGRPVTGTTQQNKPAPSATEQKKRVFVTGGAEETVEKQGIELLLIYLFITVLIMNDDISQKDANRP